MLCSRVTTILFVSFISLKFIFKTHLEELRGLSYFFLAVVFLLIFLLLLDFLDEQKNEETEIESYEQITSFKADYHVLTAISIFIFAYSNQFMIFPAYAELENRNKTRFAWTTLWVILIYSVALIATAVIAVLLFGEKLEPDLLENMV